MVTRKPWEELRERTLTAPSEARAAAMVLRHCGVTRPSVPVGDICAKLGIGVVQKDLGETLGMLRWRSGQPVIEVNEASAHVRQRFTIAHELGHLFRHPVGTHFREDSYVSMAQVATTEVERREQQANRFAANLLVPVAWLEPYVMVPGISVERLARRFQVSVPSMSWQMERLR